MNLSLAAVVLVNAVTHQQEQADTNIPLTSEVVKDALDQMRGAVMIVYPMGLPPHDPVKQELENIEDLSGTQVRFALDAKWSNLLNLNVQYLWDFFGHLFKLSRRVHECTE